MSDKTTEQQIEDILRVLKGDELAKTPGIVAEVNSLLARFRRLSRDVTKQAEAIADFTARIVKLEETNQEREIEIVKLKTRQRLMWKIIGGGLTGATAIGGTVAGIVAAFTPS